MQHTQCDQIGWFLKVLCDKLSFKSSQNVWWLLGYFEIIVLSKNCRGYSFVNFWQNWATYYPSSGHTEHTSLLTHDDISFSGNATYKHFYSLDRRQTHAHHLTLIDPRHTEPFAACAVDRMVGVMVVVSVTRCWNKKWPNCCNSCSKLTTYFLLKKLCLIHNWPTSHSISFT